jgi:hypothetical protein
VKKNKKTFLMKIKKIVRKQCCLLILLVTVIADGLQAQLSFQFMPALNGQTVNGLFSAQLQHNGPGNYYGRVKITVKEEGNKTVLAAITPEIAVKPGANLLTSLMPQSRIQFGNTAAASLLIQTGKFPEGDYEYCFEFTGTENKTNAGEQVFDDCFNYFIQPMVPLQLVYPADGDQLCNTRPELSWQPGMPFNSHLRYRVLLTEKKEKQQAADALMNNVPVVQQDNIAGYMLLYPPQAAPLQKDKHYVWQVIAYLGNTKLTQSELWEFSTKCGGEKTDSCRESYRELSSSLNGNFYIAANTLRFTITNPYSKEKMDYSITDLADPAKKIDKLPEVIVQTGLNKIDIALEDIKGLAPNKIYLIKIINIGQQPLYLRFIYKGDAL